MSAGSGHAAGAFAAAMGPVAVELLGQPTEKRLNGAEWRYGTNGSLSIRVDQGTFKSHEPGGPAGGVIDFLRWQVGGDKATAVRWMKDRDLLPAEAPRSKGSAPKRRQVAAYPYVDAEGALLFEVIRYEPKAFSQRRPDGRGGWIWSLGDVQRVPFRLPDVLRAIDGGELVAICNGEKAALRLVDLGMEATCSPGGEGKWGAAEYGQWFNGADVIVLADNDDVGRKHAAEVVVDLRGRARRVRLIELPGLPPKGDVADWIEAGGTLDQLEKMAREATVDNPVPPRPEPEPVPTRDTPLPLLWFDAITPVLDARDFVQGTLVEGGATVVYGDSGVGKTFWATDLALHVAAGKSWNGRRVDQGGVIYCALEGSIGFRNRVSVWRQANRTIRDAPMPFAAVTSSVNLLDPNADCQKLIDTVNMARTQMPCPVKLIVVDTLSRALAGGNENSPEDMGALVLCMDRIRAETGACVLLVHHSGKDAARGARGHSLLRAAIDTEIEVKVDEETGVRTACVVKQRDLAKGGAFAFRLDSVTLGLNQHGEDVTTCLVAPEPVSIVSSTAGKRLTVEEAGWYRDLQDLFADEREPTEMRQIDPRDTSLFRTTSRTLVRDWLGRRGRISVTPGVTLPDSERKNMSRYLNRLKDKGKLAIHGDLICLT